MTPRPHPRGAVSMHQKWMRLLFLHWSWEPALVQATLPAGLTVDTWDGRAWLGIVPFKMEGVRPRFLPPVPGLSSFPELNVRTYVRDARGRPGVWFYSLDCSQPAAVWGARLLFGLPYFHARMKEEPGASISHRCRRRGAGAVARYSYRPEGPAACAGAGTIEEFLVERYRLFARRKSALFTGEVWHRPYSLQAVQLLGWSAVPLERAGFAIGDRAPEHVAFSPGVDARIFGIERV